MDSMTVVMKLEAILHLILHVILQARIPAMVNIQAHIATHGQKDILARGTVYTAQIRHRPKNNNRGKHRINMAIV
jgi:hypothetical protein